MFIELMSAGRSFFKKNYINISPAVPEPCSNRKVGRQRPQLDYHFAIEPIFINDKTLMPTASNEVDAIVCLYLK